MSAFAGFLVTLGVVLTLGAILGSLDVWLYEAPRAEERRRWFWRLWRKLAGGGR